MAQKSAIVIGSGFGGAVSSCRLAQAGLGVTVIERGRRYDGDVPYPRRVLDMVWDPGLGKLGMYDLRIISEMQVAVAAGYGGGSLVYASVHLRVPADAFRAEGWPAGYTREALDPYYDLVAYMLDIKPITADAAGVPVKAQRMRAAADALNRGQDFFFPPLAIDFSGDRTMRPNKFGVPQSTCVHCGECVIGCVPRAKNTLDRNYLALAEQKGARMLTEREVFRIEPRPGGAPGYRVGHRALDGSDETFDEADLVFVCAGTVGTTELLLRSRDAGALPNIGQALGQRYSGNGDLLAFAFQTTDPWLPNAGPTITTALLFDDRKREERSWFLLEEGGYPPELWPLVNLAQGTVWQTHSDLPPRPPPRGAIASAAADAGLESAARFANSGGGAEDAMLFKASPPAPPPPRPPPPPPVVPGSPTFPSEIADVFRQTTEQAPAPRTVVATRTLAVTGPGPAALFVAEAAFETVTGPVPADELPPGMVTSALYLAMGRDLANGRIELDGDRLVLRWDVPKNLPLYDMEERLLRDVSKQLGATYAEEPFWRYARIPISVHNLGGCRMGDSDADAVTDPFGEVFHYPGLFALDGSILPGATGVNPSHTIAAVAERNIEHVIRRETGQADWTAPERALARPFDDPLTHIVVPATGTPPPVTPAVGVVFDEHMAGTWTRAPGDAARVADLRLHIRIPDVATFVDQPDHMGIISGTVQLDGLTDGPVPVVNGVFNLFVASQTVPGAREMHYALPFDDSKGQRHGLYGVKLIVPRAGLATWDEVTTLEFHVYEDADRRNPSAGDGTVRIGLFDTIKLGGSIKVTGAEGILDRVRAEGAFLGFFAKTLAHLALG